MICKRKPQLAEVTPAKEHPNVFINESVTQFPETYGRRHVIQDGYGVWHGIRCITTDLIVEPVHSCGECDGKLYKLNDLPELCAACEDCGELSEHKQIKTGKIEVLTEEQFNERWKEDEAK